MGDYTVKLEALNSGTERVGSKASRLGSMMSAGLPVPSGFVLNTEAYVKFLRHNKIANKISNLIEESHSGNMQNLVECSGRIQNLIINGIMPDFIEKNVKEEYQDLSIGREAKEIGGAALDLIRAGRDNVFVTVRPSPSSSGIPSANFSGQMKTLLLQRGHSSIINAIKECWASLFSRRAMLYRKRKRIREMPVMGVIIQKALEPEKAGFVFTNQPETGDHSRMVIEGSWGFTESIISGTVSPDEYIVNKENGELLSKKIRKKSWQNKRDEMTGKITREPVFRERVEADLLDGKEITKIFDLAARVEKQFGGHAQEIEWCESRGRIFIIDSFPAPDYGMAQAPMEEFPQGNQVASGLCVYRGTARGKARLFSSMGDMERIEKGDIIVTSMTLPDMLPVMESVSGIVTEEGSRSCHAAVVAREFKIPCIVSAEGVTGAMRDGQNAVLNASEGILNIVPELQDTYLRDSRIIPQAGGIGQVYPVDHMHPDPAMQQPSMNPVQFSGQVSPQNIPGNIQQKDFQGIQQNTGFPPAANEPVKHYDKPIHERSVDEGKMPGGLENEGITATGIKSILSLPTGLEQAPNLSDGVGLIRAEHMIMESGKHPFHLVQNNPEEVISSLLSGIGAIAKAFYPKPVWYRSIDIRTDEFRELEGGENEPTENNPAMGWHGIRRSLDQPDILRIEIEVIRKLYDEGLDNITIGLPFISSVEELREVKRMINAPIKVGIMIETPAAGLEIEEFCKEGIAFAAIGLNDLTQLTLGVDRDNSSISKLYSELNPAVISLLKHVLRTCRKHSVETSVYGDFVSDSRIAEHLVGLGVGSISTEPENLEGIRSTISRTERKLILESMRSRTGTQS